MDPLSDFTALSPPSNAPSRASRRDDSEEVTSQQCSADPNAFAGLGRAPSIVVTRRSTLFPQSSGALKLSRDVGTDASQMSQPGSQFHDALLEDTQQEDDASLTVLPKSMDKEEKPTNPKAHERERGFLSGLESQLLKNTAKETIEILSSDDDDGMDVDSPAEGDEQHSTTNSPTNPSTNAIEQADDESRVSVVVDPVVDDDMVEHESEGERVDSDGEYDDHYRRDSMDSIPETQLLEDDEEDEVDEAPHESVPPASEEFAETLDQDAMEPVPVMEHRASPQRSSLPSTPINEPTKPTFPTNEIRTPQFLKRKQKAKQSLTPAQHADVFIDTEDQTLAELSDRIRRERQQKLQDVISLTSKPRAAVQDDSQEELTPTQPLKSSPETVVHVALKKRGKTNYATAPELSASQEKSYEFIDSSCHCGETVCVCAPSLPPAKASGAKTSSAIRNLEFSFAIPESQDSESQLQESLPDVDALALKTLQAAQTAQESKQKTLVRTSPPRNRGKRDMISSELDVTPIKKRISKDNSPSSIASTPPVSRKRGRAFLSPDAGANTYPPCTLRETTPKRLSRGSKPPVAPTTTAAYATPNVRTRGKLLSPVPTGTSKSYTSRSKSVFKSGRYFCLTGFTGDGLENLTKLIEDYGGKVCQEDVLLKENNKKVVAIATPISWRKLKFMCAVACGIPVVHPEWIHGCIKAKAVIPFDGYFVPSGCSVVTGKFECQPVRELDIFKGVRFGIPFDVSSDELESTKEMSRLIAFILRECGAQAIQEDLKPSRDQPVDIVLADEFTPACEYYAKKHQSNVKTFAWVTECVILQQLLEPDSDSFTPRLSPGPDSGHHNEVVVSRATVPIGDGVQLRLHIGELLLVDLSAEGDIDHFLLFDVCEIMSIRVYTSGDSRVGSKRKQPSSGDKVVKLQVGVLERRPNSPALRRTHSRIIDLSPDKVKRRVVAVSKTDFDAMHYRDETIFYYEED